MAPVQQSLDEVQELMDQFKSDQDDLEFKLSMDRHKTRLSRKRERMEAEQHLESSRADKDKCFDTKFGRFALQLENTLAKHCKEWIKQARDNYIMDTIDDERAISKVWLSKIDENYEAYRKADEEKMDSALARIKAQFNALAKEHSKLKSLFESCGKDPVEGLVFESRGKEQLKGPQEMITMKRIHFNRLRDNECRPNHLMRFKVHKIDELYPDLQQYGDIREEIGEFAITVDGTIDFYTLNDNLRGFGYYGSAELYYLSPAPGSKPPADLVHIDGSEDVKELVNAHSENMTRVCHLYLVGGGDYLDGDDQGYNTPIYDDRFEGNVHGGEAGVYSDSASPAQQQQPDDTDEGDGSKGV